MLSGAFKYPSEDINLAEKSAAEVANLVDLGSTMARLRSNHLHHARDHNWPLGSILSIVSRNNLLNAKAPWSRYEPYKG